MIRRATFDLLRRVAGTATVQTSRPMADLLTDRLVQACTEATLLAAVERLMASLGSETGYIGGKVLAPFLAAAGGPDAPRMLAWLRAYPNIAALIAPLRDEADYAAALSAVDLPASADADHGIAPPTAAWPIGITARCLAPLAHGADRKAGNATLYRRMQVLSTTGQVLDLPYYSGNALRGQLRDLLADHLIGALGLRPDRARPPLALWFFHALYAGGVLEEGGGEANKAVGKLLGNHGAIRAEGIHQLRDMLPSVSLLGVALGNRVLSGRLYMGDLRPRCREWGTGDMDAASLMEWTYLTRREDHEAHQDHHGMIANTECLRAGTVLDGGCQLDGHANPQEAGALAVGLALLQARGFLGAENRRGLGQVALEVRNGPDPAPYLAHLADRRAEILDFLAAIGATDTSGNAAQLEAQRARKCKGHKAGKPEAHSGGDLLDDQLPENLTPDASQPTVE